MTYWTGDLTHLGVDTVDDLLREARIAAPSVPPKIRGAVYKKYLIGFLRHYAPHVWVDFPALLRDGRLEVGGEYPDQWMRATRSKRASPVDASPPVSPPVDAPPPPVDVPLDLCCPIDLCPLRDPVMTLMGSTYSRANIQDWFDRGHRTDPLTGFQLPTTLLRDDAVARDRMERLLTTCPSRAAAAR